MPALSRSTLVQLGGFNSNIVTSELLTSQSWQSEVILARSIGRTVTAIANGTASAVITFSGGDASVFALTQFLSFDDDSNLFEISAIGTTTVTVVGNPSSKIVGDDIKMSFVLDPQTSFQLRATEYTSSGTQEIRGTLDLGILSPKMPSNNLVLDSSVIPIDLNRSWVRINLTSTAFSSSVPSLGDLPLGVNYVIFAGFLSITQPPNALTPTTNPSTTEVQRFCWLISSKLSV